MIDIYSLCPGGTGKKIKFCCPNRVEEFRKIYKLLDANQNTACLNFIDGLLQSDPSCACMLAIRCVILKSLPNREQDLIETACRFYENHPENPIAIAESAQAIYLEGLQTIAKKYEVLPPQQRVDMALAEREEMRDVIRRTILRYEKAFSVPQPFQYEQVVLKLEMFVKMLIKVGFYESANAWMGLVLDVASNPAFQEIFMNSLRQLKTNKAIQHCFRTGLRVQNASGESAWKAEFDQIVETQIRKLHWSRAVEELEALAVRYEEVRKASEYWFDLALLHEWLCDLETAEKCWKEYLKCEGVSFYDALEKRIRLSFFHECPLEDAMNICTLDFQLTSAEEVLEKLKAEPTYRPVPELQMQSLNGETLMAAFDILDSPAAASLEELDPESIPVVVGNAILWKHDETGAARLEVINVLQGGADFVREAVEEVLSGWISGEAQQKVTRSISVTLDSLLRKIALPAGLSDAQVRTMKNQHCRSILLERWIHFPLGILKHQSMSAAAAKPQMRQQVETVIYALRYLLEREKLDVSILNELREALHLGPLPKISQDQIETLSPLFFDQLKMEDLTPALLERVFYISRMFNEDNLPQEVLDSVSRDPQYAAAFRIEVLKAMWSRDPHGENFCEIVTRGRQLCVENQLSDVFFDIMEVAHAMNENRLQTVFEKLKHIKEAHADDPEAMQNAAQLSRYMYGVVQNMDPADLVALQQKTAFRFPEGAGFRNVPGRDPLAHGIPGGNASERGNG
ncbi:MAG: hypothetical protein J6J31_08600 [Thermoguttaceae bacterium]|nr:hypothetical protein [Thermoguttaceae bacterium]